MGGRIGLVSLIVLLVAVLTATAWAAAAPKLVVKGDAKAWGEIEAALTKLNSLKSYRAKGKLGGQGELLVDVVNPNRYRMVMKMAGTVSETIMVGGEVRYRMGTGPWSCPPAKRFQDPVIRPEKMEGEVTASRGPTVTVAGVAAQSYTYTWKSTEAEEHGKFKIFVAVKDGLPRRWEMMDPEGKTMMVHEYYDFDAPITITLPACK